MDKINKKLLIDKHQNTVLELLLRLKMHSQETYEHSIDVAGKSFALACAFGIDRDDVKKLYTASLLHDIGKLYIDGSLLHKHDATDSEKEIIKLGHIIGTKTILSDYFDADFVSLAAHHHERLNRSGYPEHIGARKLDILDRILQVADVTSALEMARSYKESYKTEQVIAILDDLAARGELDATCVKEIERVILIAAKNQAQYGS